MKFCLKILRIFTIGLIIASLLSLSAFAIGFDAEESYNSVFVITSGNSLGSGFAIGENCIITNAHVIANPLRTYITGYDGKKYAAQVVAMNSDLDVAVLGVNKASFPYLKVANYNDSKIGDDIYAIGAPNGMAYTLTKGTLSAKNRVVGKYEYLQIDAALNEGNSGGPLMTDSGTVIGVNSMKLTDSEGIGLALPMVTVCEYLKSIHISIDENGNVIGRIDANTVELPEDESPPQDDPVSPSDEGESDEKNIVVIILTVSLAISVVLNVAFFIAFAVRKYGSKKAKLTDKDRTDFEIDILE